MTGLVISISADDTVSFGGSIPNIAYFVSFDSSYTLKSITYLVALLEALGTL